ncbi:glutamate racemase [Reinekea sp.]|jgi:glutamate racemase|uniref:glutamate racemase n=1 Tax=Reinekea sp. TaxID=1970455 RepID=UPI0039892A6D
MIGVFDSGVGGLTVLSSVAQLMPNTSLIYVADRAHAPYGDLTEAKLLQRSRLITQWLIAQGCSLIVIACNTATALAIDTLREEFDLPIVGVEPGVKPAAISSQSHCIGIMATENTVASSRYKRLLERFMPSVKIISQGCMGLADAIEQDSNKIAALLERYSQPLISAGADQLVLGCTHYPLVKDQLSALVGRKIQIVDTSDAVALEVKRRYLNVPNTEEQNASIALFSTGSDLSINRTVRAYASLSWLIETPVQFCDI